MKDIFDIFKNSKATDANNRNTTINSNLNNHQHPLPTNNNNNNTSIKKRNRTQTILQHFPSSNAKETIPNESSSTNPLTPNRLDSFLKTKTQQIIQSPSNIILPTKTSTLIKTIVAATRQKIQAIKKYIFKRIKQTKNKMQYSTHLLPTSNCTLRKRP